MNSKPENDPPVRCSAWLGRDGECCIPHRLLNEAKQNRERERQQRDADSYPGTDRVWTPSPPLQLMLTEQAVSSTHAVVPTGNPLAQLLVRLFAQFVGVGFFLHGFEVVERPNAGGER